MRSKVPKILQELLRNSEQLKEFQRVQKRFQLLKSLADQRILADQVLGQLNYSKEFQKDSN